MISDVWDDKGVRGILQDDHPWGNTKSQVSEGSSHGGGEPWNLARGQVSF